MLAIRSAPASPTTGGGSTERRRAESVSPVKTLPSSKLNLHNGVHSHRAGKIRGVEVGRTYAARLPSGVKQRVGSQEPADGCQRSGRRSRPEFGARNSRTAFLNRPMGKLTSRRRATPCVAEYDCLLPTTENLGRLRGHRGRGLQASELACEKSWEKFADTAPSPSSGPGLSGLSRPWSDVHQNSGGRPEPVPIVIAALDKKVDAERLDTNLVAQYILM